MLSGKLVRLRAVEPDDIDRMYRWENDPAVWNVSGTTEPYPRERLLRFVEGQSGDGGLFRTGQLRLVVETIADGRAVGAVDLFEADPVHRRAGVGILIHDPADRSRGYASDALHTLCDYAARTLRLHQLWCDVGAGNEASLRLFRGAGFKECGRRREWLWSPDGGYEDEIALQRILE